MNAVETLISRYELISHPEGGFFNEDFRSPQAIHYERDGTTIARPLYTSCYYLLPEGTASCFHRIRSDETWYFLDGGPSQLIQVSPEKTVSVAVIGDKISQGHTFKWRVPANTWFAAFPQVGSAYSFFSCLVTPGFEFSDWELASHQELTTFAPALQGVIDQLSPSRGFLNTLFKETV